jgi:hypothetical protein
MGMADRFCPHTIMSRGNRIEVGEKLVSRSAQALLAAAVAASILAAGALPGTSESELEAPLLIAPAPGSSFTAGAPIVFQVRTFPNDSLLLLTVSRSAARSDCGTIGGDVTTKLFKSTGDNSLYQSAPTPTAGGWMDTPGTSVRAYEARCWNRARKAGVFVPPLNIAGSRPG